jgi:hypothetical protein
MIESSKKEVRRNGQACRRLVLRQRKATAAPYLLGRFELAALHFDKASNPVALRPLYDAVACATDSRAQNPRTQSDDAQV